MFWSRFFLTTSQVISFKHSRFIRCHWGFSYANRFTFREHNCGDIDERLVEHKVTLFGWLTSKRKEGKNISFIVLSDAYGKVQFICKDQNSELPAKGAVVMASGTVKQRPSKDVNLTMKSGAVEIFLEEIKELGPNENVASLEWSHDEVNFMKNRFVYLRNQEMQRNLRVKSQLLMNVRNFLAQEGFIEIETPILQKLTPGGAHEFIVPTNIEEHFYSLGQSPQIYKQLLMIGGCDRYFQIAKCFRNETGRSDRQPEFQQIDIELSFTNKDGIIDLIENLLLFIWPSFLDIISLPFPRISYHDAIDLYGSDKPDLRSNIKLKTISNEKINGIYHPLLALVIPGGGQSMHIENLKKLAQKAIAKNYYQGRLIGSHLVDGLLVFDDEELFSYETKEDLRKCLGLTQHDYLFLELGDDLKQKKFMGSLRNLCADYMARNNLISNPNQHSFVWVVDFPMFLINESTGELECAHHPFTAPVEGEIEKVFTDPLTVTANQFDLVLNGEEIGGGSMRITSRKLQEFIFKEVLKVDTAPLDFFFRALGSGCPPHGGLAIGLDRLLRIILNRESIRDFIAFPKSMLCRDLVTSAPTRIPATIKEMYHIK